MEMIAWTNPLLGRKISRVLGGEEIVGISMMEKSITSGKDSQSATKVDAVNVARFSPTGVESAPGPHLPAVEEDVLGQVAGLDPHAEDGHAQG